MKSTELSFLVVQEDTALGLIVRRPTPLEALRAHGFPDRWLDGIMFENGPLKDIEVYRLAGNAWPVPVAAPILVEVQKHRLSSCTV
ncbi:DNA cytosine methyltransferase [Aliihoeflea sp. 2WW]|uniref:DNA cytosine methyltransferase n=1 Tax=Aliihoeflea sp. 2WW TaxID=1381123 RepID=UPI00046633A8|nr:DNA cytosine methyltransferase [Aliihoeflea sp. 2WW]